MTTKEENRGIVTCIKINHHLKKDLRFISNRSHSRGRVNLASNSLPTASVPGTGSACLLLKKQRFSHLTHPAPPGHPSRGGDFLRALCERPAGIPLLGGVAAKQPGWVKLQIKGGVT